MVDKTLAAARTRQAIRAAESGEPKDARTLLVEALQADREYVPAWLWFAAVSEDAGEQRFCLEQAQSLEPQTTTIRALNNLRGVVPDCPDELEAFVDPAPPELRDNIVSDGRQRKFRRRWMMAGTVLGVLALVGLAVYIGLMDRRETTYLAVVVNGLEEGEDVKLATQWAMDNWNNTDQLGNSRLEAVYFNDENSPAKAVEVANEIVADGRFTAVIGHMRSSTSLPAGPIYAAAELPVVTPCATADDVSKNNPWYFRTVFDNDTQGRNMAAYAATVFDGEPAVVVSIDSPYGRTVGEGFERAYRDTNSVKSFTLEVGDTEEASPQDVSEVVRKIRESNQDGPIVIAAFQQTGVGLIKGLRDAGVRSPIIAADALSSKSVYQSLLKGPKALTPKALLKVYSATPLQPDSISGSAVSIYDQFRAEYNRFPPWEAGLAYDAVDVIVSGLIRGNATLGKGALLVQRNNLREGLESARTPESALEALTRPIFFDDNGAAVRQAAFVRGAYDPVKGAYTDAAPRQLVEYAPQAGISEDEAIASGAAVRFNGTTYTVQRIVNTGININTIEDLDPAAGTYLVDFFIWFKYVGSDAVTDVRFANAVDPELRVGEPVRASESDGIKYRLYRVNATFKTSMVFTDFPFDKQNAEVIVQNARMPSSLVAYSPDPDVLAESQSVRLESGVQSGTNIDRIPNWKAEEVSFYSASAGNTSGLGDPTFVAGPTGVTYSQFVTDTKLSRDVAQFLIKNILPLLLLVLVTYVGLWMPYSDTATRVSFGVTGILTGAVMLSTVTDGLASVEYTVAIEWAYYAFILLSAILVLLSLIGKKLEDDRRLADVRRLDGFAHVFYPAFVVCTALAYVFKFGL